MHIWLTVYNPNNYLALNTNEDVILSAELAHFLEEQLLRHYSYFIRRAPFKG